MVVNVRVSLLGLRMQAPSRYQVAICISQPDLASQPIPNVTTASLAQASSQAARTEVSDTTRSPDFANRVFVLQLQSWRQSNRPAMLTCEVYAVPSKDPRSVTAGEMQSSDLVAQAAAPLTGSLITRLAKGDRMPLTLQLKPLVEPCTDVWNQHSGQDLGDKQEVSLELMLLGCTPDAAGEVDIAAHGSALEDISLVDKAFECELLCHVARATDLPLPTRSTPGSKAPAVMVMAYVASNHQRTSTSGPAQQEEDGQLSEQGPAEGSTPLTPAVTPAVAASSSPVWNHYLSCEFADGQLQTGLLQLALLNEANGSVMTRCQVALKDMQLRQHYNLQLLLASQPASPTVPSLYITLYLARCPSLEPAALQQVQEKRLTLLQTRLSSCPGLSRYPELLTVWRIEPAPAWRAVSSAPGAAAIEFTKVDAADQGQMQNTFAKLNKARQSSKDVGGVDAFPVDLASGSRWPASHGAQLKVPQSVMGSPTAVLVIEVYQWQASDASVAQSDLRTSAVARLNRARSRGITDLSNPGQALDQLPQSRATLARARVSSGSSASSSSGSSSSGGSGGGKADTLEQSLQLASELQSDGEFKSGRRGLGGGNKSGSGVALVHLGVARFPLRHMPEDRSGMITEMDGEVVGLRAGGAGGVQQGWPCVVEVQAWDAAQYSAEQLKARPQAEQPLPVGPNIDLALIASPAFVGHMMSIMTEDLLSKQTALEKLQRAVLRAEGSSQLGRWRMHEAEKRNGVLAADLAQLRRLLHEEKSSGKAALSVKGWERLPREEIVTRACQAVAAVALEKRRNAELVHRLQQGHEEGLEARQLKARYEELQEAHVTQGRLVRNLEARVCESGQTIQTVKSQEKVIAKLEGLLKQAAQERKAAVATAEKLQQQLAGLESQLHIFAAQTGVLQEENGRLKAFNKYEEIDRVQKLAAEETESVRRSLTAEADAARSKAAADVEAARDSAAADVEAIRQKASADVEAVRAQCTAAMDQLRAQYSAEVESSRTARFEELERLRADRNGEIEILRGKQAAEAEVWRAQRLADAESASAELARQRVQSAEQLEAVSRECELLRAELEDAVSREDNAVNNAEEFEAERLSASMRGQKAEASAIAAQHELIDVTKRYAREIAMLKTRLAEKDAQLMGGFGAISNMQLGASHGWLGGLPDPESIAAALPHQARPYIQPHPHPSPPRKSAWGSKHGGARVSAGRTSSPKGTLGLPQTLPALVQSDDVPLQTELAGTSAAGARQSQPRPQSTQRPLAAELNAVSAGALEQPQGSFKKASQARPVLLPLSPSQNALLLPPAARGSTASSHDSLQNGSVLPAQASTAASAAASAVASAAAVPVSNAGVGPVAQVLPLPDVQSAAADGNSASDQSSESGSESDFSETDSASDSASDAAENSRQQVSHRAALSSTSTVDSNQNAALQQPPQDKRSPAITSALLPDPHDRLDDELPQSQDNRRDIAAIKAKKKWHIW